MLKTEHHISTATGKYFKDYAEWNPAKPMLTSKQKKQLKAKAQGLKSLIQIGRNGATPAAIANIDRALEEHQLIKVKFNDHKSQKAELSQLIASETRSTIIDIIGNTLILHREKP